MPLSQVRGQSHIVEAIHKAFAQKRLHHAYLLHGPSGVGKKLVALSIAERLLCQTPIDTDVQAAESCGHCSSCKRLQKTADALDELHPDLHILQREINAKGKKSHELKIAQVRALQKKLSYQAFEGGNRVIIIDEADRMNQATANALLKTLEEPGKNTYFLLITSQLDRVLPTIISRCQALRFTLLEFSVVMSLLQQFLSTQNQLTISATMCEQIARLGHGSIGQALAYIEYEMYEQITQVLQQVDGEMGIGQLLPAWQVIQKYEKASETELRLWFHLLRSWYRDIMWIQQGGAAEQMTHLPLRDIAQKRAQQLSLKRIIWRIKALQNAEIHIFNRVGSQKRLILEALIFYLSGADRTLNEALCF